MAGKDEGWRRAAAPGVGRCPCGDWAKASLPNPQAISASAATSDLGMSLLSQ
jgi:hypothetical protein